MFAESNRFGYSAAEQLAGPVFQSGTQIMKFTLGNVAEALSGEETNVLGEAGKLVDRFTPSVWQTKLFEQAVFNSYQELVDPDYRTKTRKLMRERKKDYNQGYWWKPGEFAPERAPRGPGVPILED